jgi:DNA-binding MarR family transcriptional regulator
MDPYHRELAAKAFSAAAYGERLRLLTILRADPGRTVREVAGDMGATERNVTAHVTALSHVRLLERVGLPAGVGQFNRYRLTAAGELLCRAAEALAGNGEVVA